MKKNSILIILLFFSVICKVNATSTDSLVIQENTLGICTMNGIIENSQPGYTGEGYVNVNDGLNIGMSWSFNVPLSGQYKILWRFALGGSDTTSRNAGLYVNNVLVDTIIFKHSGTTSWAVWKTTDTAIVDINSGCNNIRLGSITLKGLANIDYFVIYGSGIVMEECVPSYVFTAISSDTTYGTVTYSPVQILYDAETEITAIAKANAGYFFHSWSGIESSTQDTFKFKIKRNTNLTALFYADGTTTADGANGYATVQHDNGTPYIITGGNLGDTVEPAMLAELETYLNATGPLIIHISKHFIGAGEISVKSNKTLIGVNDSAHIEGIMMALSNCRNIIIKNITFSKVVTMDEMEINGGKNIWIDHCEFFTDRDHDKDYYDGLLDIKNAASFITVSWCNFHDHAKSILISSGDDSYQDSVQRITFHHNYFHNCGSRLPSIRFGKSHIYSNYYENNDGAINTRVGACVKVEHNYFKNTNGAIGKTGEAYLDMEPNTNIFVNSSYSTDIPLCKLNVPYPYQELIDSASGLPTLIPSNVRVFKNVISTGLPLHSFDNSYDLHCFPNPCKNNIIISFRLSEQGNVTMEVYSILGNPVQKLASDRIFNAGLNEVNCNISDLSPGIYFIKFKTGNISRVEKIILE